jgi:hypothetical protein
MSDDPSVLDEAAMLVDGERQADYGNPLDNWSDIAAKWSITLRKKLKEPITAEEAVICMIDLKSCREAHAPKRDNLRDTAGYARVIERIQDERRCRLRPVERINHRQP